MKDFNFTLQIKGEENKVIGNIVQNDTANRFIIRLRDGISPVVLDETDIVTVTYKRSNDTVVVDAMGGGSITVADFKAGEIVIVPDEAAVTNVGMVNATVEVYDGTGHKLSSARFSFTVTPDLAGHADASTDSSFPALQNLITMMTTKNDGWESAEAQRVANENVRVTNEDGRVTAEQERAQVWVQLEEMCRKLIKEMVSPDVEVKSNTPGEYILTITDKDGSFDTPNLKPGMGSGTGDMLMADYDPDKDGSVRKADNAAKLGGKTPSQLTFGADQIITDESTDKRLPQTLEEKMDKSGGTFTGDIYRQGAAGAKGLIIGTAEKTENVSIISVGDGTEYNRFSFRQYGTNGYRENYNLPDTIAPEKNINYDIITTKGGNTMLGDLKACVTARKGTFLRNNKVTSSGGTGDAYNVSTDHLVFQRK